MKQRKNLLNAAVIVAALGYFVDIYDLLLFSIIRVPSLKSLGLSGQALTDSGVFLLNVQMIGLLVGGVFWGTLADKKGRLTVLFGSILIYSIANIANGFVQSETSYAVWRFIAGFGLAGELGAGITLVAELMPKEKRGYATTIVAAVGVSGAVAAFFIARLFDWRTSYFIGGGLGLLLLLLRISVAESGLFDQAKNEASNRGNFFFLFKDWDRFKKYISCIAIGIPLWYVVGLLITLSPEFGKAIGVKGDIDAGVAVACCYGGLVLGDIASGLLSQLLKNRLKVIYIYLCLSIVSITIYFFLQGSSAVTFYVVCLLMGFSVGYWVIFMTVAAEQFGTNIRATVATTAPNFVRGAVVPLSIMLQYFKQAFESIIYAGIIVGVISMLLAFLALRNIKDTFSKDLAYIEE